MGGWFIQTLVAVTVHPVPQGGKADPEILRNLPPRAPARLGKAHGLVAELRCKASRMRHEAPPRSRESSPLSRGKSRQVLHVHVHEADPVRLELSMLALGAVSRRQPVEPFSLEDAVDGIPVQMREEGRED